MTAALQAMERHWFAPVPAHRVALLRILVGLWTLQYLARRAGMYDRIARTDPALFNPVGPARALREPISPALFRALLRANQATNLAFILGWRHRCTGPLFGASLLGLLAYRNSWSMVYHNDNVLVLHALVLGMAPSADALSIDSRRRRRRRPRWRPRRRASQSSWSYGWPIRLLSTVTITGYFLAGVAKLKGPLGRRWATGESLRSQVAVDGLRKELLGEPAAPLALRIHERVGIYRVLAVGSLALEVGAPAVLASRRLSRLWALSAFGMHWGIFLLMKIRFRYQLSGLVFASFFELERLLPRAGGR